MRKERKFGKYHVVLTIDKYNNGNIIIQDDWFTNYGVVYSHIVGDINPCTGLPVPYMGMDSEIPRKDIFNWLQKNIYNYIKR